MWGASARACGPVGTCQSLTGAFFDDVGVIDNIPQKEYNKKGVWCMFEVDFYRLPNGG